MKIKWPLLLCALLGFALQIQTSIGINADYNGLRINLADIVLPFAGLAVVLTLAFKKSMWPQWTISFGNLWPVLLSGIMALALINGILTMHHISHWALFNKFTGWVVLMAYFLLGGWISTNTPDDNGIRKFLHVLLITFLIITFGNLALLVYRDISLQSEGLLAGLMANRTAFAFMSLMVMAAMGAYEMSGQHFLPRWIRILFWTLMPVVMTYNGSRAACIAVIFMLVAMLFVFRLKMAKTILLPFCCGLILILGLYLCSPSHVIRDHQDVTVRHLVKTVTEKTLTFENYQQNAPVENSGDLHRLRVIKDSMALWRDTPVTGIGLGSFLDFEQKEYGEGFEGLFIIDSTPLWLLVETGMLGLAIFCGFVFFAAHPIWDGAKNLSSSHGILCMTLALTLLGFAVMTLFHELLYSRQIWFALGLALAQPKTRQDVYGAG